MRAAAKNCEDKGYNFAALLEADKEGNIAPSSSWLSTLSCGNANALYNVDKSVLSYTNGSSALYYQCECPPP